MNHPISAWVGVFMYFVGVAVGIFAGVVWTRFVMAASQPKETPHD